MSNAADTMPFARLMGVTVTHAAADRVVATLFVRDDLCTAGGILHGGAIMALADSAGALGAYLTLAKEAAGTTTLESKTNFLGSARAGTTVTAEATPAHIGKRTSVWQTRITGEDGKPVALVTQTQMALLPR
jgi:uncharacterized protein (TIGR00369 family)